MSLECVKRATLGWSWPREPLCALLVAIRPCRASLPFIREVGGVISSLSHEVNHLPFSALLSSPFILFLLLHYLTGLWKLPPSSSLRLPSTVPWAHRHSQVGFSQGWGALDTLSSALLCILRSCLFDVNFHPFELFPWTLHVI